MRTARSLFPVRLAVNTVRGLLEPFRLLVRHRDLFLLLARRDLAVRTSGTALGMVWVLAQPALQMLAFWFLLDLVLRVRFPGHVPFLNYFLIGMLPWLMMNEALQRSTGVLGEFGSLYQRMAFPVALLPLLPLLTAGGIFGTVYVVMVALIAGPGAALLAPLVIGGIVLWLMPLCYLISVLGLFARDFRQIVPFLLTMAMYLTPILYMPQMLPEAIRGLLVLNPVADLLAVAHHLLLGLPVTAGNWLRPWGLWLFLLGPAWVLFRRTEPHMREEL